MSNEIDEKTRLLLVGIKRMVEELDIDFDNFSIEIKIKLPDGLVDMGSEDESFGVSRVANFTLGGLVDEDDEDDELFDHSPGEDD
jgi:hypothetical protein